MVKVTNRQVVEELRKGDRNGAAHLVDLYQSRLISEAASVFHIPVLDSEEIVNDVLLAVIQGIESFQFSKSDGDFHFWVMTIFRNRVRDHMRHQTLSEGWMANFAESEKENAEEYTETELEVTRSILRQYGESLRIADQNEGGGGKSPGKLERIGEVLDSLETWERVLLRCRALDVPYEDIAKYTGKTAKQLKVYHARVKKKFVKLLAQYYPELAGI
ncbi:MAG: sigma-70 family RNA polymerase sigma factor [Ignavibacteriales bacterium]|nr:sigma-70 family RNA polymerase sigma factor [Ignavibacteriales bacterium]